MACTTTARIALLAIICLLFGSSILWCEQDAPWRFGAFTAAGVQLHSSGFTSLPPVVLPSGAGPFTTARGPVLSLGAEVRALLLPWLYAGVEADVQTWNGTFTAGEPTFFVIGGVGTPGVITHSLDVSMTSVGLTPAVTLPLGDALLLNAGLRVTYLVSNSYEQTEAVTEPDDIPFLEGNSRRVISQGAIDDAEAFAASLTASLRYGIPLGASLVLEPELRVHYSLSSLMPGVDWDAVGVQGGVALVYAPLDRPPVILRDTVYRRDTVHRLVRGLDAERVQLTASSRRETRQEHDELVLVTVEVEETYLHEIPRPAPLFATAVDVRFVKNGKETQATTVTVEETVERRYVPLLPYVFFDEGSARLAPKYRTGTVPATDDIMLAMYYRMLDTVGARMQRYTGARLTVTGANADACAERGDTTLSARRAASVRDYLVERWKIAPGRIVATARNLPAVPSAPATGHGMEENRRAELAASDERILAPVVLVDTVVVADPPTVRFYPDVVSEAGVASWNLGITLGVTTVQRFAGTDIPPRVIDWDIAATPDAARLLTHDEPLMYTLEAADSEGTISRTQPGSIRFEEAVQGADGPAGLRLTERFSLILFDYNTAAPGSENKAMVQLIRREVSKSDSVTIIGYTDATGDQEYNEQLSRRRAEAIGALLALPYSRTVGSGVSVTLPQNLPEGRFYSRRVDVVRE